MATMRQEVWIERSASEVWSVVGDPTAVTRWFPGTTTVDMEGDRRTIGLASGLELVETVVTVHDELRRFQYRLEGPLPVEQHLASIDVIPDGDRRCLVVYSTDVHPHVLAPVLDGAVGDALVALKQLMEEAG
jgi:hypothetical protein